MENKAHVIAPARVRRTGFTVGCLLGITAMVWRVLAPVLAASKTISVHSELSSYGNAVVIALLAVGLLFACRPGGGKPLAFAFGTLAVVALVVFVAFGGLVFGNDLFFHYSLKRMSPTDWQEVATSLETLAAAQTDPANDSVSVRRDSLPTVLDRVIGLKDDFNGGYVSKGSGESGSTQVFLSYGPKSRRWGVVLGERELIPGYLTRVHVAPVHRRLLFYVGVD